MAYRKIINYIKFSKKENWVVCLFVQTENIVFENCIQFLSFLKVFVSSLFEFWLFLNDESNFDISSAKQNKKNPDLRELNFGRRFPLQIIFQPAASQQNRVRILCQMLSHRTASFYCQLERQSMFWLGMKRPENFPYYGRGLLVFRFPGWGAPVCHFIQIYFLHLVGKFLKKKLTRFMAMPFMFTHTLLVWDLVSFFVFYCTVLYPF